MIMVGVPLGFIFMGSGSETAGMGVAHSKLEYASQVTISPASGV